MFGLRISNQLMAEIAKWAEKNETNRSEAIRRLVELGLTVKAKARPANSPSRMLRAQELAWKTVEKLVDPAAPPEERAERKRRLTKGPEEFRDVRVDRPKAKGK
jgi:ribbon-helix-helix CopG family protein